MKIIENTPDRLVIEHVPWRTLFQMLGFVALFMALSSLFILADIYVGTILFLVIGAGPAILVIFLTVARNQLVFDRTAGTVEHRHRGFRGTTRHPFSRPDLKRVYIGQNGPKMGRMFLEIIGTMDAGHHPFPKSPARLADVQAMHSAASDWLAQ